MAEETRKIQKVALVTGGSRGLGLEIARILVREGWAVALVARDPGGLDHARASLLAEVPAARILLIPVDLEAEGSARAAVERAAIEFGRLDLLVNNAGAIRPAPFSTLSRDAVASSLALHVLAPAEAMSCAWPHFERQGAGRVVNVSAIEGLVGAPLVSACAAGKFGLSGLSDSVRAEWAGRGVLVTLACPGFLRPTRGAGWPVESVNSGTGAPKELARWMHSRWFSMELAEAARRILDASERGRPRVVLTSVARLLVGLDGIAHGLVTRLAAAAGSRLWRDPDPRG